MIIMVYIETDKDNKVVYQHFFPEELSDEQKVNGYLIESVPEPKQKEGFASLQYYTEKRGFWTSYEKIPESNENPKEENEKLIKRIDELETAILELTMKMGSDM